MAPAAKAAKVNRWNNQRGGFTLIEMLIVLAVLAMMAAFTLPAMRGPLDKSRLRSAGQQVQAALGKARSLSIREGVSVEFRYEVDGNHWKIERSAASPVQRSTVNDADTTTASGLSAAPVEDVLTDSEFGVASTRLLREGTLPHGVTFDSADELLVDEGSTSLDSLDEPLPDCLAESWSAPITFRPNGRSEDAELTVRGARDFAVTVNVRGLTSAVSYSAPIRRRLPELPSGDALSPQMSEVAR